LDLLRALRKLKPTVVHFSGHGGRRNSTEARSISDTHRDVLANAGLVGQDDWNGLVFQGANGRAQLVSTIALEQAFSAAGNSVKLVVLNACFSQVQAEALLAHVGCVVGMGGSISDHAARSFAIGFYGSLGDRAPVSEAYKQGRAAIALDGLPDQDQPQLRVRTGVDAGNLVLITAKPGPEHGKDLSSLVRGSVLTLALVLLTGLVMLQFFHRDARDSGAKQVVDSLGSKLTRIWGEFEFLSPKDSKVLRDSGNHAASRVEETAVQLADDLLKIGDLDVDYTTLIMKWQYVSYAYIISASTEPDLMKRSWFARRASWAAEYALYLMDEARSRSLRGEDEYRIVVDFLEKDLAKGRMLYLIALSLAIRYQSADQSITLQHIWDAISRIPDYYKLEFPLIWDAWLRDFSTDRKGQSSAEH
jgi:hypothetical protein